jgi:thiol-disulfide isomerase/thioredoxin
VPPRAIARAALAAALAVATLCLPAGWAAEGEGVTFVEDFDAAMLAAQQNRRNLVLYFSASWCQWCRKMDVTTFADRRVAGLAGQFIWVKIDTDRQNELAAQFDAKALPTVAVINADGEVIASRSGYMTTDQLLTLLRGDPNKTASGAAASLEKAMAQLGARLTAATQPSDNKSAVMDVVTALAGAGYGTRLKAIEALSKAGVPAWDGLLLCLSDERLAVRAAAGDALAGITSAGIEFDAFAAPADRAKQIGQWQTWIAANRDKKPVPASAPASAPASGPASGPASRPAASSAGSKNVYENRLWPWHGHPAWGPRGLAHASQGRLGPVSRGITTGGTPMPRFHTRSKGAPK